MNQDLKDRTNEDTKQYAGLPLKIIWAHPDTVVKLRSIVRDISADEASNANVFANQGIMVGTSPYMTSKEWICFTDPDILPAIVQAVPTGRPAFSIEEKVDFDTQGMLIRSDVFTGFAGLDRRAVYRWLTP